MRWRWITLGLVVAAMPLVPAAPARAGSGPCARFGPMAVAGHVGDSRVVELSGLAASRRHSGVLWAHNDSGGVAEVYAMGLDGSPRGAYPLTGATATDWEDIAVGPGPGSSYLYVGDIGDNSAQRASVTVYRVPEPAAAPSGGGAALTGVVAIQLKYPSGPADAEALMVDPRTGDLVIVTKSLSGKSRVLVASAAAVNAGGMVTMSDQGTITIPVPAGGSGLPGTMVTGGDISPDGSTIALRTYQSVLLYDRGTGSVASALKGTSCFGPQAQEPQGEAVGFSLDGSALITASEGSAVPIHRSGPPPPPAKTTTTTAAPPGGGAGVTTTTAPPKGAKEAKEAKAAKAAKRSSTTTTSPDDESSTTRRGDRDDGRKDKNKDKDEAAAESPSDGGGGGGGGRPAAAAAVVLGFSGLTAGALVWARRRRSVSG